MFFLSWLDFYTNLYLRISASHFYFAPKRFISYFFGLSLGFEISACFVNRERARTFILKFSKRVAHTQVNYPPHFPPKKKIKTKQCQLPVRGVSKNPKCHHHRDHLHIAQRRFVLRFCTRLSMETFMAAGLA